jgi:hypothetical protein
MDLSRLKLLVLGILIFFSAFPLEAAQLKPTKYRIFNRQRKILIGSERLAAPCGSKLIDLEK